MIQTKRQTNVCHWTNRSNLQSAATCQVYQKKTEQAVNRSAAHTSSFVSTLPICEGFTCNRLHSGEKQIPFQPSSPPDPLYLPSREQLHTSLTKRLITEPPLHTYIPPLVQPRKSQNCMLGIDKQRFTPLLKSQMSACVFPVSPLPSCTVVWHI